MTAYLTSRKGQNNFPSLGHSCTYPSSLLYLMSRPWSVLQQPLFSPHASFHDNPQLPTSIYAPIYPQKVSSFPAHPPPTATQTPKGKRDKLTCQTSNDTPPSAGPPPAYATALFSHAYFSLAVSNKMCTCGANPRSNTAMVALSLVCSAYTASGLKTPLVSVRPQSRPPVTLPGGLSVRFCMVQ